ncbi:MAG: 8-oxoguanine deaminase [Candidatus Acetothermia bacterium]|jgi:8-oxoguanine deaminase|nr:8-oxoguanine deaminase [Candidatus Acetothermia bacterium]MDH7504662.1 8-oxoguanine deaminase [Candidatus Acetothermia bacterium]
MSKAKGDLLIKNAEALALLEPERPYLRGAYLLIRGGFIAEVGAGAPPRTADEVIDAAGKLVLPGFVNAHHHLYQTLTRAYPPVMDAPLFDWLKRLYPLWAKLDEEAVYLSALVGMAELMLSGCTTTTDHHYLFTPGLKRAIDLQIEAAREIGMRFQPCRGSMSLGESEGGLPPESVVQTEEEILADSERLIERYHDPSPGAAVRISLAPCSPFSVTPELMRETAALGRRYGVRLNTHLAETRDEEAFCLERFGRRPLDYLEELGWLAPDVWITHAVHLRKREIARLVEAGVAIAHCPSSNMRLGSGIAPIVAALWAGVPVGLGVDGSASNDSSNMLLEIRQALYLQRVVHGPSALGVQDVLQMATSGGANCLGREDVGKLEPGMAADIAIFDLEELNYSGAGDPLGALVLCAPTTVETLIIGGRVVIKGHEIQTVDLEKLKLRHRGKARAITGLEP